MPTLNLFHMGKHYYFKRYFERRELFDDLRSYYDSFEYRFEVEEDELDEVTEILNSYGYEVNVVEEEEIPDYTVVINKYEKHGDYLKNAVDVIEMEDEKALVMKDMVSKEEAMDIGEEPDEEWKKRL